MQKDLARILEKYSPEIIESSLVQLYIEKKKINVKNNLLVKEILEKQDFRIEEAKVLIDSKIKIDNLSDFINIFEQLIPPVDKEINGAFFTPKIITSYIVSQIISSPNQKICDPSCGCGAFLIEAALYISQKYKKDIIDVIENNIYGVDIAEYSIRRAKLLLSLLALSMDHDEEKIKLNLKVGDSLDIDLKLIFPDTKGKFDIIIGNPPYVKYQDLGKDLRDKLYNKWQTIRNGNFNLYFAFFELGVNLLKKGGVLGYITPNNYFTSLAGWSLREYLSNKKLITKIVDFNHIKIFQAQTYTCVTFLQNGDKDHFLYERVDDSKDLSRLFKLSFSKIYYSELNNSKWRLLRLKDQENIKKIENMKYNLGKLFNIRVGIATCKDSVYFLDGSTFDGKYYYKTYNGKKYKIEKEATMPIAKISDFKIQKDVDNNSRRIIFPYHKIEGKTVITEEKIFKKIFPLTYIYLSMARSELESRDKGKVKYDQWYAYARKQGMNFFGRKLLTPTFSSSPRFLLEENKDSLFCNGYALYVNDETGLLFDDEPQLDLTLLKKILNSEVMNYYIHRTSVSIDGGYPCFQKNFIERFGIPEFTPNEIEYLRKEENQDNINNFLIKKYKLSL